MSMLVPAGLALAAGMAYLAASSGVSQRTEFVDAESGGESDPSRRRRD